MRRPLTIAVIVWIVAVFCLASCGKSSSVGSRDQVDTVAMPAKQAEAKNGPFQPDVYPSTSDKPICYVAYDAGKYVLRTADGRSLGDHPYLETLTRDVIQPLREHGLCRTGALYPDFTLSYAYGAYEVRLGGQPLGSRLTIRSAIEDIIGPLYETGLYRMGFSYKGASAWETIKGRAEHGGYRHRSAEACSLRHESGVYVLQQGGNDLGSFASVTSTIEQGLQPMRDAGLCPRE